MYLRRSKGPFKNILNKNLAYYSRDSSFIVENFLKEDHGAVNNLPTVLNYADLPNASIYYKKIFRVLNFGVRGSLWFSNGTKWVLATSSVCLALVTSDVVLAAAANNYQTLFSYLIPTDGSFSALRLGDIIRLTSHFNKVGTTSTLGRGYSLGATTNSSNNDSGSYSPTNGTPDASVVQLDCTGPSAASNVNLTEIHEFQRTGAALFKKNGTAATTSIGGFSVTGIKPTINLALATPPITSFDTSNVYFNVAYATEAVDAGALKFLKLDLVSYNN